MVEDGGHDLGRSGLVVDVFATHQLVGLPEQLLVLIRMGRVDVEQRFRAVVRVAPTAVPGDVPAGDGHQTTTFRIVFDEISGQTRAVPPDVETGEALEAFDWIPVLAQQRIELGQTRAAAPAHAAGPAGDARDLFAAVAGLLRQRVDAAVVDDALRVENADRTAFPVHFHCGQTAGLESDIDSDPVCATHRCPFINQGFRQVHARTRHMRGNSVAPLTADIPNLSASSDADSRLPAKRWHPASPVVLSTSLSVSSAVNHRLRTIPWKTKTGKAEAFPCGRNR